MRDRIRVLCPKRNPISLIRSQFHIFSAFQIQTNSQSINRHQRRGGIHIYRARCSRQHMGSCRHTLRSAAASQGRRRTGYRARRREHRRPAPAFVIRVRPVAFHRSSIPTPSLRSVIWTSRRRQQRSFVAIQICRRPMSAHVPAAKANRRASVITISR